LGNAPDPTAGVVVDGHCSGGTEVRLACASPGGPGLDVDGDDADRGVQPERTAVLALEKGHAGGDGGVIAAPKPRPRD